MGHQDIFVIFYRVYNPVTHDARKILNEYHHKLYIKYVYPNWEIFKQTFIV